MEQITACPVCGSGSNSYPNNNKDSIFRVCPVCGRYEITLTGYRILDDNRLPSYLFYHRFVDNGIWENRYHTTMSKELCDKYRKDTEDGDYSHGHPVHMDEEIIANWYPKSFSERVDNILMRLNEMIGHVGQYVQLNRFELFSLLFIDRRETQKTESQERNIENCIAESQYMLDYFEAENLLEVDYPSPGTKNPGAIFRITPKGYSRIDLLQKEAAKGNGAFVAMQFGAQTKLIREAIRQGINNAGYNAIFIDEVQHNDFITPEILKYIRDSKFVVVDLTHQNNGAYFEEGYAMGLGKPVIQLCQKDTRLHFDIAQKNTIIWETETDIPERLENRIKATID